ncbi:hypothetical protein GCM10008955_33980 [Deinococcus malanensis]|uniref:Uncharacterized protein n=2 Tax=Deinococcus malanensis TaxID=1706855 RepID=A0ABQ2F0J2_9DEIO|nr:hypothetical protein GCM10008955_33980 [Deinococcus malanensis]
MSKKGRPEARGSAPQPVTFRAGCGREWSMTSAEPDLAYTEQAFPECPACMHRVEPEGAPPFCTLRPAGTAHPFAALAGLVLPE